MYYNERTPQIDFGGTFPISAQNFGGDSSEYWPVLGDSLLVLDGEGRGYKSDRLAAWRCAVK